MLHDATDVRYGEAAPRRGPTWRMSGEGRQRLVTRRQMFSEPCPVNELAPHFLRLGLTTGIGLGLAAGIGVGLFFLAPWTLLSNAAAGQPLKVTLINGGFARIECTVTGELLVAF